MRHPIALVVKTALALSTSALWIVPAAHAQTIEGGIYYYTSAATINTDIRGNDVVIGKMPGGKFADAQGDTNLGATDSTKYTVTLSTGGATDYDPNSDGYTGLSVFNRNVLSMTDGYAYYVSGYNNSRLDIGGTSYIGATAFGYDNSTSNINGGYITSAKGYNTSSFNMSGGTLVGGKYFDHSIANVSGGIVSSFIEANNHSTININGGTVFTVDSYNAATVNINGGIVSLATGHYTAALNITGGNVGAAVSLYNTNVKISGGNVRQIVGEDNSAVNVTGGTVTGIYARGSSTFSLYGGSISANTVYQQSDTAAINFFGQSLSFSGATPGKDPSGNPGVFYDTAWTQTDGNVVNTRYFDLNGDMNNATPQGVSFTKESAGQLDISNFNRVAPDYVYGNFTGAKGTTYYDITGKASGGMGWSSATPLNLTPYLGGTFALTAQTLPGNQADLQILLTNNVGGVANPYVYYYFIPASAFNGASLTTGLSSALNNPAYVLDSSNGYQYVGSGMAFAPDLSQITSIQIQGYGYDSRNFDYRFDQFALVPGVQVAAPEPGTLALTLLILPAVGLILRRRR